MACLPQCLHSLFDSPSDRRLNPADTISPYNPKHQLLLDSLLLLPPRHLNHKRVVQPRFHAQQPLDDQLQRTDIGRQRPYDAEDRVLAVHAVRHAFVRQPPRARPQAEEAIEARRNANGAANVGAEAHGRPPRAYQGALAARGAAAGEEAVLGVERVADDVVDRLAAHERVRHRRLDVEHRAQRAQLPHHLRLVDVLARVALLALEGADPAHVAHGRLHVLHMELILEAHGEAVERPEGFLLRVQGVEALGVFDGRVEEDLVQAICLFGSWVNNRSYFLRSGN
jgi:hypothetical protein